MLSVIYYLFAYLDFSWKVKEVQICQKSSKQEALSYLRIHRVYSIKKCLKAMLKTIKQSKTQKTTTTKNKEQNRVQLHKNLHNVSLWITSLPREDEVSKGREMSQKVHTKETGFDWNNWTCYMKKYWCTFDLRIVVSQFYLLNFIIKLNCIIFTYSKPIP